MRGEVPWIAANPDKPGRPRAAARPWTDSVTLQVPAGLLLSHMATGDPSRRPSAKKTR
jgi:hypothetical protein